MIRLARILVYPLKSLDGVPVEQASLLASGALCHDRQFAIRDGNGRFVNGKRTDAVHGLRSTFDLPARRVEFRAGDAGLEQSFDLDRDRAALDEWLSGYFNLPVKLVENNVTGFPDDTLAPGPTLVSTATLAEVASWFPGLTEGDIRRRFRANLEVDGIEPFGEDRLVAEQGQVVRFQIGDIVLDAVRPCQRCVVPSRDPLTGAVWRQFAEQFAGRRQQALPPWAIRSQFDHFYRLAVNTRLVGLGTAGLLRVGDELRILGVAAAGGP